MPRGPCRGQERDPGSKPKYGSYARQRSSPILGARDHRRTHSRRPVPHDVVRVARAGRRAVLLGAARATMTASAEIVTPAGTIRAARLRRVDRIRLARQHADPRRSPRGAAARARALACGRHGRRRSSARSCGRWCSCARGRWRSGSRAPGPVVAETMLALLNAGITPVVYEHGSLGASGDLAPLAHAALALIGEGEVWDAAASAGRPREVLAEAGIEPPVLTAKEGLALDQRHRRHPRHAGARAGRPRRAGEDGRHHGGDDGRGAARHRPRLRRPTCRRCGRTPARRRRRRTCGALLAGSPIVASHRYGDTRVQDAYSLRCTPSVHGAARDTIAHAAGVAAIELRSAIDNPMILPDGRVESCGNFHGAPLGFVCDFLAIATAEIGAIAERRTDRLLDATRSHGLPPFLTADAGREQRDDDRALHAGRHGGREPAAGRPRERRLAADERDAGGPRLDGLGCGPQAAPVGREPGPHPRRRAVVRGARTRPARAARTRRRRPARRWPRCGPRCRAGAGPVPRAGARRGRGAGAVGRACWRRPRPSSARWSRLRRCTSACSSTTPDPASPPPRVRAQARHAEANGWTASGCSTTC